MGIIYKITNPSDKIYVGKTYDLRKRINSHKCAAKQGRNIPLHNSIRKHGWDAHILEIIEEVDDSLLDQREIYWIEKLNTYWRNNPKGLNMTLGGDGQRNSWMDDIERRKKASIYFTENNFFKGKKHTEESKKIMSEKASKRNKEKGITIPKWGAEKGRLKVIKACVAYDNNGDFIGEFDSLINCSKILNISVNAVKGSVIKKSWVDGKYFIKYKTENYPLKINVGVVTLKAVKRPVIYIDKNGFQKEYPSAYEASLELNIPKGTISRAALTGNLKPIRAGHIFVYKDLFEGNK